MAPSPSNPKCLAGTGVSSRLRRHGRYRRCTEHCAGEAWRQCRRIRLRRRRSERRSGREAVQRLADRRRRPSPREGSGSAALRRHPFRQRRRSPIPSGKVREITGGGADFTFEATGQTEIAEHCYKATCRAGTTVLIGQPTENAVAGFPPYWIAQDENRVIGSSYGSTRPMIDFPKVLRLVKHGLLDLEVAGVRGVALRAHQRSDRARRNRARKPHGAALRRAADTDLSIATVEQAATRRNVMSSKLRLDRRRFLIGTAALASAAVAAPAVLARRRQGTAHSRPGKAMPSPNGSSPSSRRPAPR